MSTKTAPPDNQVSAMLHEAVAAPTVLHVRCVSGEGGGPEKTIFNSPRFLRRFGYRGLCAYLHPPDDECLGRLRRRAEAAEAPLVGILDRGPLDARVVRRLQCVCRENDVAVWHGHDYKSNLLGILVRRAWPMKLVTTVHGWVHHTWRTRLYYAIDRRLLRRYDEVLCVSEDLAAECLRAKVDPSRCRLIPNGIDVEDFRRSTEKADARRRLSEPLDGAIVGAMGRLSEEKGFDLLIRAVPRLLERGLNVRLLIAGEGPQRGALETLIDECGARDRIRLLGHVERPQSFFEALDVFALSSLREGLPNVLLEAMALETPVVATRIAGVPSLVSDGENGVLIEPGSVEALAEGLSRLLADCGLRSRLAQAARRTIETSFSFEERMRKVAEVYDRLLSERHRRQERIQQHPMAP